MATCTAPSWARLRTWTRWGCAPGDRVMIVNENCAAAGALTFATSMRDAWPVIVNARMTAREIDTIADHAGVRRIFFTSAVSPEAAEHGRRHGATPLGLDLVGPVDVGPLRDAEPEPVHDDPARQVGLLVYTSGTTGAPKGVMLSHQAALFVASSPGSLTKVGPGDVSYGVLPMAHIYGLTSTFLRTLYGGAHLLSVPRFDAAHLADALAENVTAFQGVPQMFARLLDYAEKSGRTLTMPKLRFATIGGAYVEPDLKAAAEDALGVRLIVGYGMTEFASTVTRSLPEHVGKDTTVGPPLPGIDVRIVDGVDTPLPAGETGEIWLSGPNRMLGYYRNEEASREVLTDDGWYRTGDLGWLDDDNYIHYVERQKEVIIRSGFNVYPVEVEEVLSSHPAVTLSGVVGRAVKGNEEIVAYVELAAGEKVAVDELAVYAAERLAPYKRPAEIHILESLPAAPTGKILKKELRAMARGRGAAA